MTRARAEAQLAALWRTTFTAVATAQEAWLEQAFVRRGAGIIEHVYPDVDERRRLYQYGLPPAVGRRFEAIARRMRELLVAGGNYGSADPTTRIDLFEALGNLVSGDRGFGFRVRRTDTDEAILEQWSDVLRWWMNESDVAGPSPENLRSWQRFVADNLEFRLGVAIGAVVADAWADGAEDVLTVPSPGGLERYYGPTLDRVLVARAAALGYPRPICGLLPRSRLGSHPRGGQCEAAGVRRVAGR